MRILLLFLLPFFLFAKPFKVATYNVENLFDSKYTGSEYPDYQPNHNWTERMVDIKLNHTAEVICDLDADILGLQEIENDAVLRQLQKRLKQVGCPYPYRAITHKRGASIQSALLSRFPIIRSKDISVSRAPGVRSILEAVVEVDGRELYLFVNHWKSRSRDGRESKRIVYAKALDRRLKVLPDNIEYLLIGDFNTDHDAALFLEKRINDTDGKTGLHHILQTTDSEIDLFKKRGVHYTLWGELPFEDRWNTKFYGKRGTPDHILLSKSMVDGKGIEYVNDSFQVFKKGYLFTKRGYINRWEYKKGKHRGRGYSDHLPIFAYFDTKPYKQGDMIEISNREEKKIDYLYRQEQLSKEVVLKNAVVIWKRHQNALIKQSVEGRGVFLYGCAGALEKGKKYDLLVRGIKTYKGLKEVTHAYILKQKGSERIDKYLLKQDDMGKRSSMRQNELFKDIVGIYKNRYFYSAGKRIPIYFKKRKFTPPNGSKLKIAYAHLGYYKELQLVVYSPDDFKILE